MEMPQAWPEHVRDKPVGTGRDAIVIMTEFDLYSLGINALARIRE